MPKISSRWQQSNSMMLCIPPCPILVQLQSGAAASSLQIRASGKIQYSSEEAGYKSAGLLFQSLEGQESCQCLLYSQRHLVPASSPLFYQMTQGLAAGSLRCIGPLTGGAQLLGPDAD